MRKRSGALHCESEEQLLELASNNQLGLYYNERPTLKGVKFQKQWTITETKNTKSQMYENFDFNQEEEEAKQQLKQLNKAVRYFPNCVVDKQNVQCSNEISVITTKIEETLSNILNYKVLLTLFLNSQETLSNSIHKHTMITSFPNSNVFSFEKANVESCKPSHNKQNGRMSPKNWFRQSKSEKMMELLIVKKHICIKENTQIASKRISIIHRIFIVNEKYLQNPLIQIYLRRCNYLIDARIQTFKEQNDSQNISNIFQDKSKINKSFLEKDCKLFNRGEFSAKDIVFGDSEKFKNVFHKIQERIRENQLRRLNEILAEEKIKSSQPKKKQRR